MTEGRPITISVHATRFDNDSLPWGYVIHRTDRPAYPEGSGSCFATSDEALRAGALRAHAIQYDVQKDDQKSEGWT